MKGDIPKAYESKNLELEIYKLWKESGDCKPQHKGDSKNTFTIILPPPNANGNLHLGHTCGYSFHDCIARYMRMTGHPTLLVPGKDHAGIQTEAAFTKYLLENGDTKESLGREEFF